MTRASPTPGSPRRRSRRGARWPASRAAPITSAWTRSANRLVAKMAASPRLAEPDHGDGEQAGDGGAEHRRRGPRRASIAEASASRESRAATWAGTKTGTCAMTRSASRESGAKWGRPSRASTTIACVVQPRATLVAFGDMRTKRGDAESGLAVDQKVDLVGEQVSVIHDSSGPSTGRAGAEFQPSEPGRKGFGPDCVPGHSRVCSSARRSSCRARWI